MAIYMHSDEYEPSGSVLAYYPFEDDSLDSTGKSILTYSGTKDTIGYRFTSRADISGLNNYTVNWFCGWIKLNSASGNAGRGTYYDKLGIGYWVYDGSINTRKVWTFYTSSYSQASHSISEDTTNRNLLGVGYDGTNTVYAINGEYGILRSGVGYNFGNTFCLNALQSGQSVDISYSKFIADSKCRTESEYLNFYNTTKSKYGL